MTSPQDFLNQLRIASPCPADWAAMAGDDRSRFCATCEKHVYDFSRMTAAEGLALIREKEGQVCARLWRRPDGTVITADCPVGVMTARARRKTKTRLPLAAAMLIAAAMTEAACAPKAKPQPVPPSPVPAPRPTETMTTTFDYSGVVPGAKVTIHDWTAPFATMSVGNLISGDTCMTGLDMTSETQGIQMSKDAWEHLPIR